MIALIDPIGLFFALLALGGGGRRSPAPAPAPSSRTPAAPQPAPWPQLLPEGLPPFPGRGWEYDEPPPPPVVERARQLVTPLWRWGKGSHKTEMTGGRWITFRAEIVRSGKQGVVAYRLAPSREPVARAPSSPAPSSRAPSSPAAAPSPWVQTRAPAPGDVELQVPGGSIRTAPAAAEPSVTFRVLRRGMGQEPQPPDPDVLLVQQKLGVVALDTPLGTGGAGRFGPTTEKAVKAFQSRMISEKRPGWKRGDDDGKVGNQTWTALFAVRA